MERKRNRHSTFPIHSDNQMTHCYILFICLPLTQLTPSYIESIHSSLRKRYFPCNMETLTTRIYIRSSRLIFCSLIVQMDLDVYQDSKLQC